MADETIIIDIQVSDVAKKLAENTKEIERLKAETKALDKTTADGAKTFAENQARIKDLTAANKGLSAQIVALDKDSSMLGDSLNEQARELTKLKDTYASLNSDQKKQDWAIKLKSQIDQLDVSVKKGDAEIGNFQRNVGNYPKAADQMAVGLDNIGGSAGGVIQGFKGMATAAKAFIMNPIGAVIAALAGVAMLLVKAFQRTQSSMKSLNVITGTVSGVFSNLMKTLEPLAKFLVDKIVAAFESMGGVISKVFKLISDGLRKLGFKEAADGLDSFVESSKQAAKESKQLADAEFELQKRQRESRKIQLDYQNQAEKWRQIRDDESRSIKERTEANAALGKILKKQLNEELSIGLQAVNVAKLRIKLNGETEENLNALAEAETNVMDIRERITGQESEQLVNINSLRKEASDAELARITKETEEREKALKEKQDAADRETEILRQSQDAAFAILTETAENAKKIATTQAEREIEDLKKKLERESTLTEIEKDAINAQIKATEEKLKQTLAEIDANSTRERFENEALATENYYNEKFLQVAENEKAIADLELQKNQERLDGLLAMDELTKKQLGLNEEQFRAQVIAAETDIYNSKKRVQEASVKNIDDLKQELDALSTGISDVLTSIAGDDAEMQKFMKKVAIALATMNLGLAISKAVAAGAGNPVTLAVNVGAVLSAMAGVISSIKAVQDTKPHKFAGVVS